MVAYQNGVSWSPQFKYQRWRRKPLRRSKTFSKAKLRGDCGHGKDAAWRLPTGSNATRINATSDRRLRLRARKIPEIYAPRMSVARQGPIDLLRLGKLPRDAPW